MPNSKHHFPAGRQHGVVSLMWWICRNVAQFNFAPSLIIQAVCRLCGSETWVLNKLLIQQRLPPTKHLCNALQKDVQMMLLTKVVFRRAWSSAGLIVYSTSSWWRHTQLFPVILWHVLQTPGFPIYQEHLPGSHEASNHIPGKVQQPQLAAMWQPSQSRVTLLVVQSQAATKSCGLALVLLLFTCLPVRRIS